MQTNIICRSFCANRWIAQQKKAALRVS